MNDPDFTIANYGGITALTPMSVKANDAIAKGLISFENWQVRAGSIFIDHRIAANVITNLRRDGFAVEEEGGRIGNTLQTD